MNIFRRNMKVLLVVVLLAGTLASSGCLGGPDTSPAYPDIDREEKIPEDVAKRGPETDNHPPILHSDEYHTPVPMPYPVSTAGAEDSPFILPDGNTMYFFFTPDVRIPPEKQILDDVTGVYVTHKIGDVWSKPERVWLQEPGKLSLDGAVAIQGNEMWFASAREGNYRGVDMWTAQWENGAWRNWQNAGSQLNVDYQIGEVHLHGNDLYFHSDRPGGTGERDIWVTTRTGGSWSEPVNIEAVNTETAEGFPFISSDGMELWFTRRHMGTPAIFRSLKADGEWGEPELIVSQFAGEPTLDDAGNLYFVHHYFENDVMIEADIYVAYRK